MQSLLILGRQPALGMAELERLYGAAVFTRVAAMAALADVDPCLLAFDRLGGSTKFCKVLTTLDTTKWSDIQRFLMDVSASHASRMPEGKMYLGLSVYGLPVGTKQLAATGLTIKKLIRETGRPVRLVNNDTLELSTAQIAHNKLLSDHGWELVFVRDGNRTIVAQTIKVQDIASYTRRDRERPKRDARVGMLPPKLAQIIVNLAAGRVRDPEAHIDDPSICLPYADLQATNHGLTVLDPFCGTGVVLQEASLMGYDVYGTDIEQRMVDYTTANLTWFNAEFRLPTVSATIEPGDATSHQWSAAPISFVAGESYLGRPLVTLPSREELAKIRRDCDQIIGKSLANLANQLPSGITVCLAVPAWQVASGRFEHLPLIDDLPQLGYNRISLEHVRPEELLYYRPDQVVARELLVLIKK